MKTEELLIYEMPTIAEFIGNKFLQSIIAKIVAKKINKKMKRYNKRMDRANFFSGQKLDEIISKFK